jgi:predicted Zn-dependent protease
MSGGHFNENGYIYFKVEQFADELENAIDFNEDDENGGAHLSREVLSTLCRKLPIIRETARVMRHIDRLYSGDIGEETFMNAIQMLESND